MTMIRFEGLTNLGEALEAMGANPAQGLSVGTIYEVNGITASELDPEVNTYHYMDDDGDERQMILDGSLFTFSIFNITH